MKKIPKIALLVESSTADGRGLLKGIAKYSSLHGPWNFYMKPPYYREPNRNKLVHDLKEWQPDGIILRETKDLTQLIALNLPTILCTNLADMRGVINWPTIVTDDLMTGKMGADHLLKLGFKNFAYCGLEDMIWAVMRGMGYTEALHEAGYEPFIYKQPKAKSRRHRQAEQPLLAKWLKSLPKPIALFCCNDERAFEVIEACKFADIHIPQDIAILGVGNNELACTLCNPHLSSIQRDIDRVGYDVAELMDRLIHGEAMANQKIILEPLYVKTRQSTNILAVEDKDVAKAIHFIRDNSNKIIQVDDIVDVTTVSHRVLQKKFRNIIGRTINEELLDARIDYICRMLVETDLSISQVVLKMGYSDINHISRCFKRAKNMTPLEYRKRYRGESMEIKQGSRTKQ